MKHANVPGQIMRFGGVGIANSALYFILATTLNGLFGLATFSASVIAYGVAAVFAYQGHRYLTFRRDTAAPAQISRFIMATAMGLSLALVIPILLQGFAPLLSFLSVMGLVPICSFLMMKYFVFRA